MTKIALVHDWLNQRGGAEDVLETLVEMCPESPVFTSIYWEEVMPETYRSWDIRTSFMNRLPLVKSHHQSYLPFYPRAFKSMDLSQYDLILSNKSGFCHGVNAGPDAVHVCYCLTPTRFLWEFERYALREGLNSFTRAALKPILHFLRQWDKSAADRVDHFIAISSEVQRRIKDIYQRESAIIYPPVDMTRFEPSNKLDDFYLVVSRLVPYKRIDLAVKALSHLDRPLLVAGEGRDKPRLQEMAGPNVTFLGRVEDEEVADLMSRCRVFLFPGVDDFGITPVQAMAAGRPVVAFAGGGALDTVIDGETGVLFNETEPQALASAIQQLDNIQLDVKRIRQHAELFSKLVFEEKLSQYIGRVLEGKV